MDTVQCGGKEWFKYIILHFVLNVLYTHYEGDTATASGRGDKGSSSWYKSIIIIMIEYNTWALITDNDTTSYKSTNKSNQWQGEGDIACLKKWYTLHLLYINRNWI